MTTLASPQTRIVPCSQIKTGDRITEMDTPEGPFYRVVRETAKTFWFAAEDEALWVNGEPVEVRSSKSPRAGVRVLCA